MFKNIRVLGVAALAAGALALSGCGQKVEIPPANVGKVMTKNGYKEDVIPTSKIRLEACVAYCDKLVLLDVSDNSYKETIELFMPKDKLKMDFDLRMTMSVDPEDYDQLYSKIPPVDSNEGSRVYKLSLQKAYSTYAQQIVRAEAREYLSQFSIAEVASNREAINANLSDRLSKSIKERTPFSVKYIGIANVNYPDLIIKAQERSAERREQIQQEEAQLEVSKVQLERTLQETQMQRNIDVERAEAEAEVNRILADSVTPAYVQYRSLNALDAIANSENKVFVPSEMVSSMATQVMVGNSAGGAK